MDQFRIALAQIAPTLFDKDWNLAKAGEAMRDAASGGATAILFPELYLTGYNLGERAVEMAEREDGPSIRRVAELARIHQIAVLMGYAALHPNGQQAYDAALIVNPEGKVAGIYRKTHLFHGENRWFVPGDRPMLADFGLGRVGILICYDLEFPEAVRDLALRGAQWIATCTGNMVPNQHLQEIFVQARAAENRVWVAIANRIGREAEIDFFGGSAVADPNGRLAVQADDRESIILADIDLARADEARLNADYLADRRPDLYRAELNG